MTIIETKDGGMVVTLTPAEAKSVRELQNPVLRERLCEGSATLVQTITHLDALLKSLAEGMGTAT